MPTDQKLSFSIQALKTRNGLLKLFETILGAVCLGLVLTSEVPSDASLFFHAFFFSITVTLFVTCLLLLSYLMSPVAAGTLPKTIFELLHHGFSFFFYATISIAFLISEAHDEYDIQEKQIITAVLGVVNSAFYFMSLLYSYQSFKAA